MTLPEFFEHIKRVKYAEDLLKQIWQSQDNNISNELFDKIKEYFKEE